MADSETTTAYLKNTFFSAGYLMAASCVAVKCLSLVPELASWIIPEGESTFAARGFGEGVAGTTREKFGRIIGRGI